jgi:hypothetical protein
MIRAIAVLILVGIALMNCGFEVSHAQDATVGVAGIAISSCDDFSGSLDYELLPPRPATGPAVGLIPSTGVGQSFSAVPVSFDALIGQDTAIVVTDSGGVVLACGDIGGRLGDDGSLNFGLTTRGASGIAGIAYVVPANELTNVSLFVTGLTPAAPAAVPSVPEEVAAEPTADVSAAPSGLSADEQAYANAVLEIVTTMSDSLESFGLLFANPRIGEEDWTIQVAANLVIWQLSYDQLLELTPPPAFEEVHLTLLTALSLYSSAADDIAAGIDSLDATRLEEAVRKMEEAIVYLDEANRLVRELQAQRGGQ